MKIICKEPFHWLLLLGCLLTAVTVSCANRSTTSGTSPSPSPDSVHVLRVSTLAQVKSVHFEISVTDSTRVQQLYQAIESLPKFPANTVIHCPLDDGVKYHLDFFQSSTLLSQAILDASGCRALHLTTTDIRRTNDAFWSLLAKELGVPTARLLITSQRS
jgi:hypothetical protein